MIESMIYRIDEATYDSGRLTNELQIYRGRSENFQFFDAECNWTRNTDTARFYHILAEDRSQAEALAVEEYAREFRISQNFIEVISSQL